MEEYELLSYAIMFAKLENGNQEWDWEQMRFIDRS